MEMEIENEHEIAINIEKGCDGMLVDYSKLKRGNRNEKTYL